MILRVLAFILGIFLCSLSLTFLIIYMNLLNMGYSFFDYVNFIIRRFEVLSVLPGIVLIVIALYRRKEKMK